MMIGLTAAEIGLITACPAAAAIIAIICIAFKIIKAYKGIEKTVSEKVDRETVNTLIEEIRIERKENKRLRKLLIEALEAQTKIEYEGSHDSEGNKKV